MASRHREKVQAARSGKYDLLLIGDSITHNLEMPASKDLWDQFVAPRHALNSGDRGARTKNILWNLQNGELQNPSPAAVDKSGSANSGSPAAASLLGTRWDFHDGDLSDWRHKDNAALSYVEDAGNRAIRVKSGFKPQAFAWATRYFTPRSMDGVAHVNFRLHGDSSGHQVQVHLGAPSPRGGKSLYYMNRRQAVRLDFSGWRNVSLDVEQFQTPDNGLRDRDLAGVTFLEFMIHARDPGKPVDAWIDDIEFTGPTAAELADQENRRQERKRLFAEGTVAIAKVRQRLSLLRDEIDRQAAQGKYAEVARVYWTALDWCAKDAQRLLQAEELELVRQAAPLVAAIHQHLDEPQAVVKHVLDRAPQEKDLLDSARNPYFRSVIGGIRRAAAAERSWPKGREGYRAVPDAWSFRRFGDDSFAMVWAITRPRSPLRHHPMLLTNALNLFDTIAHQHADGDFNLDRTAAHGKDTNINRFCLAPALDAWCELSAAYPDLLPAAKAADLEAGLRRLVDHQVRDYGTPRLAARPELKHPAYPNMDVHYLLIMELAHRLWKEPRYAKERDAFFKLLQSAVYPMGAMTYVNAQNECFVYHHLDVVYLARYWKLSGDPAALELLRKTIPYYPHNVEPAGMPEYYTDACWKHYWGAGDALGPGAIAALFDDPLNQQVASTCAAIWGFGRGHLAAIVAECWKPVSAQPLPDNYVLYDTNVQGPRGRFGPWSFAGNGRNYGVGFQGKDTFVGCMLTDPAARPLPLDAAIQVVTTEVRLNPTDNHWNGGRCHSARERLTTALGPDFGSLAVRYTVSRPHWNDKQDELFPWEGTQAWYLAKTRLVGLVSLEATADDTRAAIHGRIRLGLKRPIEQVAETSWKYGRLLVTLHGHNYAKVVTGPSETFFLDAPKSYRSTEITLLDPKSIAAGQRGEVLFKQGTRCWFLVEVRPENSPPAEAVQRLDEAGLVGFRFRERGRRVVVLFNPTEQAVEASPALDAPAGAKLTLYEENDGKGRAFVPGTKVRLGPYRHIVVIADSAE